MPRQGGGGENPGEKTTNPAAKSSFTAALSFSNNASPDRPSSVPAHSAPLPLASGRRSRPSPCRPTRPPKLTQGRARVSDSGSRWPCVSISSTPRSLSRANLPPRRQTLNHRPVQPWPRAGTHHRRELPQRATRPHRLLRFRIGRRYTIKLAQSRTAYRPRMPVFPPQSCEYLSPRQPRTRNRQETGVTKRLRAPALPSFVWEIYHDLDRRQKLQRIVRTYPAVGAASAGVAEPAPKP